MVGRVVDNSGNSDIIDLGSEKMYRKSRLNKVEPMPKKQFNKIKKAFQRHGGLIQQNEETDEYLSRKQVEGITYNENTILLRQKPGRASVFEELIHTYQYKAGKIDGTERSRILAEIEAQEKLIKFSKAYKLTEPEIVQTRIALENYKKDLDLIDKEMMI